VYYVRPIQDQGQPLGTFVALHLNAGEQKEAFDALRIVFQGMFLILVLALILAWLIAGRVLAPLRLLVATARTISETNLTQRIPIQGQGELADLTKTFNDMMDRVETAFATQRDFVNDASHELRTPITIIRGYLEVMEENPQEQRKTVDLVINELDRMNRFVQDLLFLAKYYSCI
jgi:signal transduction histidine kinase